MLRYLALAALAAAPPPLVEPPPLAEVFVPAVALQPAQRVPAESPAVPAWDSTSINGACTGLEALLGHFSSEWDVHRMSRIAYRESRCQPDAYNRRGRAAGLLQITPITFNYLSSCLGEDVTTTKLFDPVFNVRAAACLFTERGYQPWAL